LTERKLSYTENGILHLSENALSAGKKERKKEQVALYA